MQNYPSVGDKEQLLLNILSSALCQNEVYVMIWCRGYINKNTIAKIVPAYKTREYTLQIYSNNSRS